MINRSDSGHALLNGQSAESETNQLQISKQNYEAGQTSLKA
jgi:hypothetical protein